VPTLPDNRFMGTDERLWAIERLAGGLGELVTVIGPEAAPVVERVKARLIEAMAARDDGRSPEALTALAAAMADLVELGDRLDPAEGAMMRMLVSAFIEGLGAGDREQVEAGLQRIQEKTGTPHEPQG